jgi:RecA-family ATPase
MTKHHEQQIDLSRVLAGIPKLDLSKVKTNKPLIEDFLMEGTTQLCYGKAGTRKTTIHLLAGWAVSQGIPFLGKKTEQRMVLYLDYENPAGVLKTYCKDLGIDPSNPWFTIWDRKKHDPPKPGDKDDPDDKVERFIRRCRKATGHYPWIIYDSFTSLLRAGKSGNDIGDATPVYRAIRSYCDRGATNTIIDHVGKKGKGPIGTSAKMSQMDTAHLFTKSYHTGLEGKTSLDAIRIDTFQKRFAPEGIGAFSLEIHAAMNEKQEWHTTSVLPVKDISVRLREKKIAWLQEVIIKHPDAGQEELAKYAAEKKNEKKKTLIGAKQARLLYQEGEGKFWKSHKKAKGKKVFRVLKGSK